MLSVPPASIRSALPRRISVGGQRHRLQSGRAEAVDGLRRHRVRQPGQQRADAGHVHALLALRHRAADDDVVDPAGIDARRLGDDRAQHVRQQSSGRVLRNTPRGALPTGVRVAATM
jgi:hypothetical protein